jgi:hypothetical protein
MKRLNRSNRTARSLRRYRDSQAKLIIAKRRYQDALRRYRDAEDEAKTSKLKAMKDKLDEKFAMFAKDHPELSPEYKHYKEASLKVSALFNTLIAGGVSIGATKALLDLKKAGLTLKDIGMSVPRVIGIFVLAFANAILAYVEWKKGKELEKERLLSERA